MSQRPEPNYTTASRSTYKVGYEALLAVSRLGALKFDLDDVVRDIVRLLDTGSVEWVVIAIVVTESKTDIDLPQHGFSNVARHARPR